MSPTPSTPNWQWNVLATAPAVLLLGLQASWVWPFFSDDSFISLRYAERLLTGHGLTWTDGADGLPEYVEGYSNLLWVVLTAGVGALGIDLVTAARLLGALLTMAALYLLAAAQQPRNARTVALAAIPPLLVAAAATTAVWTLAGLEGPLLLLLLAWGFSGLLRTSYRGDSASTWSKAHLLRLGVPFALACWTRPDGPLWALCAGCGIAAMAPRSAGFAGAVRRAFWFGLPACVAVLAQLLFRIVYYGDYVPNTAHVKAEFDPSSFGPGLAYVEAALRAHPGVTALALLAALFLAMKARPRTLALVFALPLGAWFTYLAAIGGDHFPGFRLLHGALAPLALLAGLGLRALGTGAIATSIALVLGAGAVGVDAWQARTHPKTREARSEDWEWRDRQIGLALRSAFAADKPLLAVEAAGALPFYSRLPALDLLGLCDRTIATTPFPAWLDTMRPEIPRPPGHLRGNGAYVMERAPDLMVFKQPLPTFVSGCEFESDPRFLRGYRCVLLDLGTRAILPGREQAIAVPLWVRVEGRVGVKRSPDRITVPAYLFGAFRLPGPVINRHQPKTGDDAFDQSLAQNAAQTFAFLTQRNCRAVPDDDGRLQLALAPATRTSFALTLPAGRWRARIAPADARASLRLRTAGGAWRQDLALAAETEVEVELRAPEDSAARLTEVTLERIP